MFPGPCSFMHTYQNFKLDYKKNKIPISYLLIFFTSLILGIYSQFCTRPGQCDNGNVFLATIPANNAMDCLKNCQSQKGCSHATFYPSVCNLFKTCRNLETKNCPNCITSSINCTECFVHGSCVVSTYLSIFY